MSKPFKCSIRCRSEAKRRYIMTETPDNDPGYTVKDSEAQRKSRWDIVRKPGEDLFAWDGLTEQAPGHSRMYPAGV